MVSLPVDINVRQNAAIPLHVYDPLDEDRWLFGHNGAFLDTKVGLLMFLSIQGYKWWFSRR